MLELVARSGQNEAGEMEVSGAGAAESVFIVSITGSGETPK